VATTSRQREEREARERARLYQARQSVHAAQRRRRTRDNLVAGIVGGVLLVALVGVQTVYYVAGPGAPEPAPSGTPVSTDAPSPSEPPVETPLPTP